ncbi:roundabout homolog 4 isoform 1-T1 [Synchiropus picturatus]
MRFSVWLLWATFFYTCAQYFQRCMCQELRPPGLDKRTKSRVKEHGGGRQHAPHRSRPQYRKVFRARAEESPPSIVHHPSDVVVKVGNPATLSCRVEGNPKPTIEWLHNGQPPVWTKVGGQLQPLVLSEGSLFFLNVGGNKRGPSHEGVYTCVATNSAGKAVSRNASLHIAVLQEEFGVQPSDMEVAEGETAILDCEPPTGHPEPNVMWKKDGLPIKTSDFHYAVVSGKLVISPAQKNHSGVYVCVASNTVGVRESRAARLSVLAKPVLVLKPEDASVKVGESAQFYCQAKGDPPPAVVWSREQGPLPNGRYLVDPDQTLQIHYVTPLDAGRYTCTAANDVGVVSASGQLTVEDVADTEQKDLHKELSALRVVLEDVAIMAPGSNMSRAQWRLQSLTAQPHYLDGFEVLYRSLLPTTSDWTAKKVELPGYQTQLGPLRRGFKYEFKVRPFGGSLYGRESNTRHLRVPEIAPGSPPQAVSTSVSPEKNNSVHLDWQPPPPDFHNGIIQGYQVWCVEPEENQYQNWTVDSSRHGLDISGLQSGKHYWITVAAVNGAGVGMLSDPHGFIIDPLLGSPADTNSPNASSFLALLQNPVFIGCICALSWCILMIAAVCLFRHHSRMGALMPGRDGAKGLHRLHGEDLIIKHRMVAPDSPWISGTWRPAFNQKYQDLWAQGHKQPGLRSTACPAKKELDGLDASVPIVTDSCGVYGTFYVDLMGSGLRTFNSPGRCPKMPHGPPQQPGAETIQIFTQPTAKTPPLGSRELLPWKQGIRPQPKMGVLRESWEKNCSKQELQAVNSVPLLTTRGQACPSGVCKQRLSHVPSAAQQEKASRLLHYSASLHLVDMLPPPPPLLPLEDAPGTTSLSSDEGSSRSTKLTVDLGSAESLCGDSGHKVAPRPCDAPYSLDDDQDGTLTAQEAVQYLELSHCPERLSVLPEQRPSLPHLRPLPHPAVSHTRSVPDELEPAGRRRSHLRSTPSSCYSEWDGSLWNTWSSVMDGDMSSARTSLISSVDSCCTSDSAHLARLLAAAAAADSVSGASLSDFSPPASPLSGLYAPFRPEVERFGEPVPAWDWSLAWVEEMEAQYRNHYLNKRRHEQDSAAKREF